MSPHPAPSPADPAATEPQPPETTVEGTSCRACGYLHAPARSFRCLSCGGRDLAPVHVPLRGVLETYTLFKAPEGAPPAGIAMVRLDAGPRITCALRVNGVPPTMGARVEGVVERVREHDRSVARLVVRLAHDLPAAGAADARALPEASR